MTLIGYWPLNESSGSTAYDHSGRENHAAIQGAGPAGTGLVSGPLSQSAFGFDGADDVVRVGSVPVIFDGSEDFSISVWFQTSKNEDQTFVSLSDDDQTNYRINKNGSGEWVLSFERAGNNVNAGTQATDGKWHHGIVVYDSDQGFSFYLDGKNDASFGSSTWSYPSTELKIGYRVDAGTMPMDGSISEVRVYNRALTPRGVHYLYSVSQRGRHVTSRKSS